MLSFEVTLLGNHWISCLHFTVMLSEIITHTFHIMGIKRLSNKNITIILDELLLFVCMLSD